MPTSHSRRVTVPGSKMLAEIREQPAALSHTLEACTKTAEELRVADRVTFTGRLTAAMLDDVFQLAISAR